MQNKNVLTNHLRRAVAIYVTARLFTSPFSFAPVLNATFTFKNIAHPFPAPVELSKFIVQFKILI